jgi:hypothetical protein
MMCRSSQGSSNAPAGPAQGHGLEAPECLARAG